MATNEQLMSQLITETSNLVTTFKNYKTVVDTRVATAETQFLTTYQTALATSLNKMVTPGNVIILYVDPKIGADTNDGLTRETAFKTIAKAVSLSSPKVFLRIYLAAGEIHEVKGRHKISGSIVFTRFDPTSPTTPLLNVAGATAVSTLTTSYLASPSTIQAYAPVIRFLPNGTDAAIAAYKTNGSTKATFESCFTFPTTESPNSADDITVFVMSTVIEAIDWSKYFEPAFYAATASYIFGSGASYNNTLSRITIIYHISLFIPHQNYIIAMHNGLGAMALRGWSLGLILEKKWYINKFREGLKYTNLVTNDTEIYFIDPYVRYTDGSTLAAGTYASYFLTSPVYHAYTDVDGTIHLAHSPASIRSNLNLTKAEYDKGEIATEALKQDIPPAP